MPQCGALAVEGQQSTRLPCLVLISSYGNKVEICIVKKCYRNQISSSPLLCPPLRRKLSRSDPSSVCCPCSQAMAQLQHLSMSWLVMIYTVDIFRISSRHHVFRRLILMVLFINLNIKFFTPNFLKETIVYIFCKPKFKWKIL